MDESEKQILQRLDALIKEMKGLRIDLDKKDKITSGLIFGLEGITDSFRATVTTAMPRNFPFSAPVDSIWILSDGPSDMYVSLNKSAFGDAPMQWGELMTFQTPEHKIKSVHFECRGTAVAAAVRFWTIR